MIELLTSATLYSFAGSFLLGLVLMASTGSVRHIKWMLGIASVALFLALLGGMWFTKGILIFLTFQLVVFIIILYFFVIAGAVCGAGIHKLLNSKSRTRKLLATELGDYLSLADYCRARELDEPRVLPLLRSGFYRGGTYQGHWYVHRSEVVNAATTAPEQTLEAFAGKSKARSHDGASTQVP